MQKFKYLEAQKRVKQLKGFYIHLSIYLFVNLLILFENWQKEGDTFNFEDGFNLYISVLWGIVILIHAISVFLPSIRNWEKRETEKLLNRNNGNK